MVVVLLNGRAHLVLVCRCAERAHDMTVLDRELLLLNHYQLITPEEEMILMCPEPNARKSSAA